VDGLCQPEIHAPMRKNYGVEKEVFAFFRVRFRLIFVFVK
jgi:hypothetical protein